MVIFWIFEFEILVYGFKFLYYIWLNLLFGGEVLILCIKIFFVVSGGKCICLFYSLF